METLKKKKAKAEVYFELFREIQFAQLKGRNYHLSQMQAKYHIAKDFTKDDIPDLTGYPLTTELAMSLRDDIRAKANARRKKEQPAATDTKPETTSEEQSQTPSASHEPVQLDMFCTANTESDILRRLETLEGKLNSLTNLMAGVYRILNEMNHGKDTD